MRVERRTGRAIVALVVVATIAAVTVVVIHRIGRDHGERVLIIGDSVTAGSSEELLAEFSWTSRLDVQGLSGFRTDQMLQVALRKVAQDNPEIVVVLTGYNDLAQEADTTKAVAQMMDLATSVPCAVWVLLPIKGEYPMSDGKAFDDRIERLAAEHRSVHVTTAWRDAVDGVKGRVPNQKLVKRDRTHPTPAGSRLLARIEEEAVSRHCR